MPSVRGWDDDEHYTGPGYYRERAPSASLLLRRKIRWIASRGWIPRLGASAQRQPPNLRDPSHRGQPKTRPCRQIQNRPGSNTLGRRQQESAGASGVPDRVQGHRIGPSAMATGGRRPRQPGRTGHASRFLDSQCPLSPRASRRPAFLPRANSGAQSTLTA
jgi:hypothetical protein